jgi:L-iditol 2-dehydrogenase
MRAYILERPGQISLANLPRPVAGVGEVIVRVRAALTCGTDVKAFVRGHPKFPMPTPFGHEFSGEIAEVGPQTRGLREGDAIMAVPTAPCGHCYYCQRQQENLCDTVMQTMVLGAYSEFVKLPARHVQVNLFPKPPALDFPVAALLEPLSCVLHGLEFVNVRRDDTVVLIGVGAISLLHLLALRIIGVGRIIAIGRRPQRSERARALGADEVIAAALPEARERVLESTGGRGADTVIECTGQVDVWEAAPGFVRRGGQIVFFGGCPSGTEVRLDTQRLHYDQVRVISPFHFTPRAVRRAREILCEPSFRGAELISGVFPLEQLPQALAEHRSGHGVKYAILP